MKTAAAYIRVSTEDQVEYSPASQLDKIREYAKRNGYILPDEYVFTDEGISGRDTKKRAAFNKMIGMAKTKPKPFDAILVWKFSRFARSREDSIVYKSMLRKQCGIDVISVSENVGDDKMSVLIEALIEAMDEYYSINLAEEVRRGMTEKVRRGEAVSIPSYGYDIENGSYIPNADTAPVVRRIFSDYTHGVPMRIITRELNEQGCRTTRGNLFECRTVRYILSNPVYIGKIRWCTGGKDYRHNSEDTMITDGRHEPLIDMDTWNEAQSKLAKTVKYSRQQSAKKPFMLQGLVRCGSCGGTLTQSSGGVSLQCCKYAHGTCGKSHSVNISKINQILFDALEQAAAFNSQIKIEAVPAAKARSDSDIIRKKIENERAKLKRVKEAYEGGVYTLEELRTAKAAAEERVATLEEQHNKLNHSATEGDIRRLRVKIANILPSLRSPAVPEEVKNGLLKSIAARIVFYRHDTRSCDLDIFFYA